MSVISQEDADEHQGSGADVPELVYFNLFDDCNVRCNMCECWKRTRSARSAEDFREVLDRVLARRPRAIRFTGGEPLLLRGLPGLVRRGAESGARVSVITNGRLLTSKARRLADAGCAEIVISLDGVGATHDRIRRNRGLFDKCLAGIDAVTTAGMSYGVNTVVQRMGVEDLQTLADLLLSHDLPPRWWHLIPVRDHDDLVPTAEQRSRLRRLIPALIDRAKEHGVDVIADPDMFGEQRPAPCTVPTFIAYVRADSGEVYGCNMLAYADGVIADVREGSASGHWGGSRAEDLRARCAEGTNTACSRCDPASRTMNHFLRRLAADHALEGASR
ncbi:radical SAM/SPASM domain-containing protein [Nocardiopsis sp. LOL_012]|uniref:radical SAM protein n=1 Tax=Nocardiopsis sp. LOL_012 TaxID=3345409 RepID=UPI003A8B15AA